MTHLRRTALVAAALAALATGCADGTASSTGNASDGQAADAAASASPASAGVVTVVGQGSASGTPDTLVTTLGVEVGADTVDAALAQAGERATAVIDAVLAAGVAEDDVQTTQLRVEPRYGQRPDGGGQRPVTGFRVINLLDVRVRAVDTASDVLSAAIDAGGDQARVQGIRYVLEDDTELRDAARETAFADARRRAEQWSALADQELGELVSISEQVGGGLSVRTGAASADAAAASVPLQAGSQQVTVTVEAVWSLG